MPVASANGLGLYYEEHGAGESLLLIGPTGWPGSVWDLEQVPVLRERYRVITYDQRGIGLSDKPDEPFGAEQLALDALALLEAVDAAPAHVLGFGPGGLTAQVMALRQPASVRSLVLCGASTGSTGSGGGVPLHLALELATQGYGPGYWLHHLSGEFPFTPGFRQAHPEKVRALAETIEKRQAPLKLHLRHGAARGSYSTLDRLGEIGAPALVLVGSENRGHTAGADHLGESRLLAERIPGAELQVIEGVRHLFAWEKPEQTNRLVLDFLQRHSTAEATLARG
jgi:pimeloyl-ACP methyl ester carboxylesterase